VADAAGGPGAASGGGGSRPPRGRGAHRQLRRTRGSVFRQQAGGRTPLPLISLLAVVSNAVWLVPFSYQAPLVMITVTVFHGLQYLAIVMIVHVKERARAGNVPAWRPAAGFYAGCLALAYLLFHLWPRAYVLAGFSYAQSYLLIVSVINIHHFIVDAFIWRLRRDPSYAAVAEAPSP
jgi:hypothetical protein